MSNLTNTERYRVLCIGDPAYPISTTGFGIATGKIIEALLQSGRFDVVHLPRGMMPHHQPKQDPPYRIYIPPSVDPNGFHYAGYVCDWENPHLVIFESDPGSITEWRKNVQVRRVPNLTHGPVEGAPLTRPWSDTMKEIVTTGGQVTVYTHFAKRTIEDGLGDYPENGRAIEVLGLGIDHAPFRVYTEAERNEIRRRVGWTGKFVVMNVARNAGRKMLPRLIYAMRIVREVLPQAHLYLHTLAFENYYLSGHNLFEIARTSGLDDGIEFNGMLRDAMVGIPYTSDSGGQTSGVSLIDLYNAADLFVSVSGAEGWNLPATEAAACGLPVCVPMYSGGWEVAQDFALGIPVRDYETHPSGAKLAAVQPQDVAEIILELARNTTRLREMRERGLAAVKRFRWENTTSRLVELALELAGSL